MNVRKMIVLAFVFCAGAAVAGEGNLTQLGALRGSKVISDGDIKFTVKNKKTEAFGVFNAQAPVDGDSLVLGYPTDLIGESHLFGGVIIRVSDKEDENLGNLKLSDVSASVVTELQVTAEKQALLLKGLPAGGSETSNPEVLLEFPVTQVDRENNQVFIDLAAVGEKLDIMQVFKNRYGDDMTQQFVLVKSQTVAVDFSHKYLIFDVQSDYDLQETLTTAGPAGEVTTATTSRPVSLTVRWYLRLNSSTSPFFEPRRPTEGVGYFLSQSGWIARFPVYNLQSRPVKYYIKNVPAEHLSSIIGGFEDWNSKLERTLGYKLLSYEIIPAGDARNEQIVTGDPRYNVLEWDLDNAASYGGLGPSLKNEITGEIMAAQTSIQGPKISELYKGWFRVAEQMEALNSQGQSRSAELLRAQFLKKHMRQDFREHTKATLKVGALNFKVNAIDPRLQDEFSVNPMDFIEKPEGYTYEAYMDGYFREMVAHELGHNLGLRHNFKGSLSSDDSNRVGTVSRSVMEYNPRAYRHLGRVAEYDVMAIAYGYLGIEPEHKDWFCTDENQAAYSYRNSAECTNGDATSDSFAYLEKHINRGLDLLLARGSQGAPVWTAAEVLGGMNGFISQYTSYITTAMFTAHTWQNFFGKEGRPATVDEVPAYVIGRLNNFICSAELEASAKNKSNQGDAEKALENLATYRKAVLNRLKNVNAPWGFVTRENFSCLE